MINNNHEFLNQFRHRCFALRSKATGAKFRGGYPSGFTLTEILIVVIIIGILATLALPMLVKTLEKAKLGEAASNLNLIRTGEKIYFLEWSTFTTDLDSLNIEDPNAGAKYFDYNIESADSSNFSAKADRKSSAPSPYSGYDYFIDKNGTITSNGPLSP